MHGVYPGGIPREDRAEVRMEEEAERKGLVITPATTVGTRSCITWAKSRSHISEISQQTMRELGACTPPPASHWKGLLQGALIP